MNCLRRRVLRYCKPGMSLIEIMLVMTIVAALIGGVIMLAKTLQERARVSKTRTIVQAVHSGVEQYKIDIGKYPERLIVLVEPPADQQDRRRWQGPYVPERYASAGAIRDDYSTELEYKFDAATQNYELFSWGKGRAGSEHGHIFPNE